MGLLDSLADADDGCLSHGTREHEWLEAAIDDDAITWNLAQSIVNDMPDWAHEQALESVRNMAQSGKPLRRDDRSS